MSCEYCKNNQLSLVACYIPLSFGDTKDVPVNYCPNCGEPLAQPEPLSLEQLQGMNDHKVYVRIPDDFEDDLIMSALVACNADNDDDPDEVYLTNNLGGRSTYDEVIDGGGAVYARKPREG